MVSMDGVHGVCPQPTYSAAVCTLYHGPAKMASVTNSGLATARQEAARDLVPA